MIKEEYTYWLPDKSGTSKEIKTKYNAVIFIGANGAGKSRLGAWMEKNKRMQIHRIGAQRDLNFEDNIPLQNYSVSEDMVMFGNANDRNRKNKFFKYSGEEDDKYVTHLFNDFTNVLSALIAKSNNERDDFIRQCKEAENNHTVFPHTPETDIDKLMHIWIDIFPHRNLKYNDSCFSAYDPEQDKETMYSATKMSDGERTALYFIAQVLCVPPDTIILIDEPELHLHKSLMNRLWMALEKYRQDCLFIYITHDTQFAALHAYADKYWVKNYNGHAIWEIERIEEQKLPEDMLLILLGNRKSVLFVEGEAGSCDAQLYALLYKSYYVIPCGSCTQVIARTKAYNNTKMLHRNKAYGIIDRDYRSEHEIEAYKSDNIFTIDVAEVENLFITEEMIKTVARQLGKNEETVFQEVRNYVIEERFKKQIDSQICQAVVAEIQYRLNILEIDKKNEAQAKASLNQGLATINFESIKKDVEGRFLGVASSGDYRKAIRIFNDKDIAKSVGHYMSLQNKDYCSTVIGLLQKGMIDIEKVIGAYMPANDQIPR